MTGAISGDMSAVPGTGPVTPAENAGMRAGQRIGARVIEVLLSGDVLLAFGQSRAVVPTIVPLQAGDRVMLEVVTGGVKPELRIVTDHPAASPLPVARQPNTSGIQDSAAPLTPRDLPVILRALAEVVPGAVPMADALQKLLHAATVLDRPPAAMDQIQRQCGPLNAALPAEALAVMVRTFIAQSGLFTEGHLRAALNLLRATTADERQPITDLRLLLGQLTAAGTPVADAVRSLGDALLQQQLIMAERLASTGVGHVSIPFMFGERQVDVVFEWEREARRGKRGQSHHAITVGVFVQLPALGAIETRVEWKPDSLAVTFYVERDATRALVEAGLADFSEQLSQSGCPAVTSNVWLNPGRLASVASLVKAPASGGTILDVIA